MQLLEIPEGFQDQDVNAALDQGRNLLPECVARLLKGSFAQRFDTNPKRSYGPCYPSVKTLCGFLGEARAGDIDCLDLVGQTVALQTETVRPKRVGFDDLGARLQIFMVQTTNEVGLRNIQLVVATVDENAFAIQKRACGPIAKHGSGLQAFGEITRHTIENTVESGSRCWFAQNRATKNSFLCSDIIRSSHLTLYPSMFSKIPGLRRTSRSLVLFAAIALLLSCSSYSNNGGSRTQLTSRAFVSNPVHPTFTGGGTPVLEIMDTNRDLISGLTVPLASLSGTMADPGMMSVSPNRASTLVMSTLDHKLGLVDNTKEAVSNALTLPGVSDSFFLWTDNTTAFVAIPSAPVVGQAAGAVEKINMTAASITATIPIPGAHYVVPSPKGNQILVFSDNLNTVVLLTPSLIGVAGQPTSISQCTTTQVPACTLPATFDRPIGAVFDPSSTTAYVLDCGPECGGTTAGVTAIDMTNTGNPGAVVLANQPVAAATVGLLQGTQFFVAGTQTGTGGVLTVLNLTSGLSNVNCTAATPVNCQIAAITDGYHTGMQMGSNGRLFIGSKACIGINGNGICMSIFDTSKMQVVATPNNTPVGDVTGIAPIPNRNVVYVCQGGFLRVYDTTTDQLETFPAPEAQPNVIGQAIDVKVVDF